MVEGKDSGDDLSLLRLRVQQQGDVVRTLKSQNAPDHEIKQALAELKLRKKIMEEKEIKLTPSINAFDRSKLEDLLKQKFFYDQAFSIYGGVQGLYDFGPMGCAMKSNLIAKWREHFILEDHLLEVECPMLTPHPVLKASGHVQRFTDLMVKDAVTGECYRADHLLKANLEAKLKHKKTSELEKETFRKILTQLDNYGANELSEIIREYNIKAPTTNNDLTEPQQFNLMFETMIGPTGQCKGYLRPETAQGIFVNFQRLLHFNQGRIPFGAAQIGSSFRNEISPRSGLIRVREFSMAEIEYFVDPADKRHPKFDQVKDLEITLYSSCDQMDGQSPKTVTVEEAVKQGTIANETLGYFMARIHLFLVCVGIDPQRLRFRQHLSNEMAHYACDCWDAECQTSYGWIECVGCADRSCYDLTQHSKATGARLVAEKQLAEPVNVKKCECQLNKQAIGKAFRADAKTLTDRLNSLSLDEAVTLKEDLVKNGKASVMVEGKQYDVDKTMVTVVDKESTVFVEEIVPNVIEPSFGIGRVLYVVFEHRFRIREGDEQRTYLSVPPVLAPYKCSILPLSNHRDFAPYIRDLSSALTRVGVSHRVDDSSGSIGRRYARTDQIGIPYGITIDFDTVNKTPASATLRERDSMKQVRVPITELTALVNDLANGLMSWSETQDKYPAFEQQETGQQEPAIKQQKLLDSAQISQNKRNLSYTKQINTPDVVKEEVLFDPPHKFHEKTGKANQSSGQAESTLKLGHQDEIGGVISQTLAGDLSKRTDEGQKQNSFDYQTDVGSSFAASSLRTVGLDNPLIGTSLFGQTGTRNEENGDDGYMLTTLSLDRLRFGECSRPADIPVVTGSWQEANDKDVDEDGDFPPLPNRSCNVHHGLFIGQGWSSNRPVAGVPETGPTAVKHTDKSHGKKKKKTVVGVNPPAKEDAMDAVMPAQSDHVGRDCSKSFPIAVDWRVVLASLYENVGELNVRRSAEDEFLHLKAVANSSTSAFASKPTAGLENTTHSWEGTPGKADNAEGHHGVFVGTGWSVPADSKSKTSKVNHTATRPSRNEKKAVQPPTPDNQESQASKNQTARGAPSRELDDAPNTYPTQKSVKPKASMDRASYLLDGILKETISEWNVATSRITVKSNNEKVNSDQSLDPSGEESVPGLDQKNSKPVSSPQNGNPPELGRRDSLLTQASSMRSVVNFLHQTDPADESCASQEYVQKLGDSNTTVSKHISITDEQGISGPSHANQEGLPKQESTTCGGNNGDGDLSNKPNQASTIKRSKGSRKHKPKRKK